MKVIDQNVRKADEFQKRRGWLGFPIAVLKKFGDDRAGNLAALIAYYGFFSLFPLLLVMVSILGLVLRNNEALRASIVNSTLAQFPIIGDQIRHNVTALSGANAGVGLGIGTATALWAGLGVTQATQNALNDVWGVPLKERPNFLESKLRGLIMLAILGTLTLGSTFLSGLGASSGELGVVLRVVGFAGSIVVNFLAFAIAYRVLTDRPVKWKDVFVGAIFAAIAWGLVQALGSFLVSHQLKHATQVYGFFGFVLGLLAWIYLGAQIMLYGAEINVVRAKGLWPRSLKQPPLTEGDKRTMRRQAQIEERMPPEEVDVRFEGPEAQADPSAPAEEPKESDALRAEERAKGQDPKAEEEGDGQTKTNIWGEREREPAAPEVRRDEAAAASRDGRADRSPLKFGLAGAAAAIAGLTFARRKRRRDGNG